MRISLDRPVFHFHFSSRPGRRPGVTLEDLHDAEERIMSILSDKIEAAHNAVLDATDRVEARLAELEAVGPTDADLAAIDEMKADAEAILPVAPPEPEPEPVDPVPAAE